VNGIYFFLNLAKAPTCIQPLRANTPATARAAMQAHPYTSDVFVHVYQTAYGDVLRVFSHANKPEQKNILHGHRLYMAASVHHIKGLQYSLNLGQQRLLSLIGDAIPNKMWPALVTMICARQSGGDSPACNQLLEIKHALFACNP
jgi:hypothetical protein